MKTDLTKTMVDYIKSQKTISINGKLFQVEDEHMTIESLCKLMHIPNVNIQIYVNDAPFPIPHLNVQVKIENGDRFEIIRSFVHGG